MLAWWLEPCARAGDCALAQLPYSRANLIMPCSSPSLAGDGGRAMWQAPAAGAGVGAVQDALFIQNWTWSWRCVAGFIWLALEPQPCARCDLVHSSGAKSCSQTQCAGSKPTHGPGASMWDWIRCTDLEPCVINQFCLPNLTSSYRGVLHMGLEIWWWKVEREGAVTVLIARAPRAAAINTAAAQPPLPPAKFPDLWEGFFITYNGHFTFPQLWAICEKIG